jgi:hypothetical protein
MNVNNITDMQATKCKYYNCAYGCLNNKFCEFLKGLNESEFIKVHPEKTIIDDDGYYHIFNTAKKHSSDPFPQVDITELIDMYNSVVSMYNECLYIMQNSINTMLEESDRSIIKFKMKIFSSLPNIVYPIKELLKLIRLMGMNIRKMVDIIYMINEIVKNYDLESIEDNNYVHYGGSLLDDAFIKVENIKNKLKTIKNFVKEDFHISKFINRFDQEDQFINTPNETTLIPFDLKFDSANIPKDVTKRIKEDMEKGLQGLQNVFSMRYEENLNNNIEKKIEKLIDEYNKLSNTINDLNNKIVNKNKILKLSESESELNDYLNDGFNFSNGDVGDNEKKLLADLESQKELKNNILNNLNKLSDLVTNPNFKLIYDNFITSYKTKNKNLLLDDLEKNFNEVNKKIDILRKKNTELMNYYIEGSKIYKLFNTIFIIFKNDITNDSEYKNMNNIKEQYDKDKYDNNYNNLIELIKSQNKFEEIVIEKLKLSDKKVQLQRQNIVNNLSILKKMCEKVLKTHKEVEENNKNIESLNTIITIWENNLSQSDEIKIIRKLSESNIKINFTDLYNSISTFIETQKSEIELLDKNLNETNEKYKEIQQGVPQKDFDKINNVIEKLKIEINKTKIQTGAGAGSNFEGAKIINTNIKNTIINNINNFGKNSKIINNQIIKLVSTISTLKENYQKYLTNKNDLIFEDQCEMYKITQLIAALEKFSSGNITNESLSYDAFVTMSNKVTENTDIHSKNLVNRMKNFIKITTIYFKLEVYKNQNLVLDQSKKSFLDLLTFIYLAESE